MLEMELIKNLQNTQNQQKMAYTDLEKALMLQTMQNNGGPMSNPELAEYFKNARPKRKIRKAQSVKKIMPEL